MNGLETIVDCYKAVESLGVGVGEALVPGIIASAASAAAHSLRQGTSIGEEIRDWTNYFFGGVAGALCSAYGLGYTPYPVVTSGVGFGMVTALPLSLASVVGESVVTQRGLEEDFPGRLRNHLPAGFIAGLAWYTIAQFLQKLS